MTSNRTLPSEQTLYLHLLHRRSHPKEYTTSFSSFRPIAFVYAVTSTHIYCLPTCPARLARRSNIKFYPNPAAAKQNGFRPCKRCQPDLFFGALRAAAGHVGSDDDNADDVKTAISPEYEALESATARATEFGAVPALLPSSLRQSIAVARACGLMEEHVKARKEGRAVGSTPSMGEVAARVGMSKWHFGRVFKRVRGVGWGEWTRELDARYNAPRADESEVQCGSNGEEGGLVVDMDLDSPAQEQDDLALQTPTDLLEVPGQTSAFPTWVWDPPSPPVSGAQNLSGNELHAELSQSLCGTILDPILSHDFDGTILFPELNGQEPVMGKELEFLDANVPYL